MSTAARRVVRFALDVGESIGLDGDGLCRGLSFDPSRIPDHVSWSEFVALLDRIEQRSEGRFEQAILARGPAAAPELRTLGAIVEDPELVVRVVVAFGSSMYPHVESEIEGAGARTLLYRMTIPAPHATSGAFVRATAALLVLAPTHVGLPRARVRYEDHGRTTTYTIVLPDAPTTVDGETAEHRRRAAELLIDQYAQIRGSMRESGREDLPVRASVVAAEWRLTARQTEVLLAILRGSSNKEIAAALGCAEGTVRLHVTQILKRAGVASRAELFAKFLRR